MAVDGVDGRLLAGDGFIRCCGFVDRLRVLSLSLRHFDFVSLVVISLHTQIQRDVAYS